MTLNDTATIVALAGTSLTGAGFVTRWLFQGWKKGAKTWERIDKGMFALQHDVDVISREVKYNGTYSLREKLSQVADDIRVIHHETRVSTAARRVAQKEAVCEMIGAGTHGRCAYVTHEWTRLTGLTREGMEDGGWLRCVPLAEQPRIARIAEAANEHAELFQAEYWIVNVMTGARTYVRHSGEPVFDSRDDLVGWTGHLYEVTPP